jgi:hypothetical protein
MTTSQLIGNRVSALIPVRGEGITSLFTMVHPDSTDIAVPYTGTPTVGVHYAPSYIEGESIYFSLPLHYCNERNNAKELLDYILNEEFED